MGNRTVAPPPPRLQRPVGAGMARVCTGAGLDIDSRPLETAFRLRHALRLLVDPGDPAVLGTIEEHLAHL